MKSEIEISEPLDALAHVPGFKCAAVASGIRRKGPEGRLDLGICLSEETSTTAAAVFTQHDFAAAPVLLSKQILNEKQGHIRGFVVNSGNANACTGKQGEEDARTMVERAAQAAGVETADLVVCSTGRIGDALPMPKIEAGLQRLRALLTETENSGAKALAEAILTSDTRPKCVLIKGKIDGKPYHIAGIAKGAGMIQPDMATMLAFVITDLEVPVGELNNILKQAVNQSFNRITIDGDQSTNDTVLVMANGKSGIEWNEATAESFGQGLTIACQNLARKIVVDGEKITRVVTVQVSGADTDDSADKVARCIANSLLVKSSWYGGDPNWGRLLDAAGYAGANLSWEKLELFYEDVPVILNGEVMAGNKEKWRGIVNRPAFTLSIRLQQGEGSAEIWTTDLSEAYVNFNKSE